MRERPILMSGPLVRAILDGRKTQTRRVLTLRGGGLPGHREDARFRLLSGGRWYPCVDEVGGGILPLGGGEPCPYGQVGDRLWVRESYAPNYFGPGQHGYMADWTNPDGVPKPRWTPSIHMKREHSRLSLVITDLRVERLQEISEEDAGAEGVDPVPFCRAGRPEGMEHVEAFEDLWDSINGQRKGCSWADNPWVWALTFEREGGAA